MGCFFGGLVGLWASMLAFILPVVLIGYNLQLGILALGLLLLAVDEGAVRMLEEEKHEEKGFLDGLLVVPVFFWGIVLIVCSGGLVYFLLEPLKNTRKELRRQFYLMMVVGFSLLSLVGPQATPSEPMTITAGNLHTLSPGMNVKIVGSKVTRLNSDCCVLVVGEQLVVVRTQDESPPLEFSGRTHPLPSSEPAYDAIVRPLRALHRTNPDFQLPLFSEAMVSTGMLGALQAEGVLSVIVILAGGFVLFRMVRSGLPFTPESGWAGWPIGALLGAASLAGLAYLHFELLKMSAERDDFAELVRSVPADSIDPANDGMPVMITGELKTDDVVEDKQMGVRMEQTPALFREVAMLQYDEIWNDDKMVGHQQVWDTEVVPCPSKPNAHFPITSEYFQAATCKVGAFTVPGELVSQLELKVTVGLPEIKPDEKTAALGTWETEPGYQRLTIDHPRLGEVPIRVRYMSIKPQLVTVMGQQDGNTIKPFPGLEQGQLFAIFPGRRGTASIQLSEDWVGLRRWAQVPLNLVLCLGLFLLAASPQVGRRKDSEALLVAGVIVLAIQFLIPSFEASMF